MLMLRADWCELPQCRSGKREINALTHTPPNIADIFTYFYVCYVCLCANVCNTTKSK